MMWRARGQDTGPARDDVPPHVEEAAMGARADKLATKHQGSIRATNRAR
jgi:hypothetical protein